MKGGSDDEPETPAATEGEAAAELYAAEGTGAGGAGKTELADGDVTPKTGGDSPGAVGTLFNDLTKHINLVVVLIVVSIPEGLPLTI